MSENRVSDEELAEMIETHEDVLRMGVLEYSTIPAQERFIAALTELQHYRAVMKGVEAMLTSGSQVILSVGLGGRYEATARDGWQLRAIDRGDIFTAIDELVKVQGGVG